MGPHCKDKRKVMSQSYSDIKEGHREGFTGNIRNSSAYVYSHHPGTHRSHVNTCRMFSHLRLVHRDTGHPLCSCLMWSPPHCSYRAHSHALCPAHNSQAMSQERKDYGLVAYAHTRMFSKSHTHKIFHRLIMFSAHVCF